MSHIARASDLDEGHGFDDVSWTRLWETFRASAASVSVGWDHPSTFCDATLLGRAKRRTPKL